MEGGGRTGEGEEDGGQTPPGGGGKKGGGLHDDAPRNGQVDVVFFCVSGGGDFFPGKAGSLGHPVNLTLF